MIELKKNMTIHEMVHSYPELNKVLVEIGFVNIVKPGMLQTMGKIMTLEKGSKMMNIPWQTIEEQFHQNGFKFKEAEVNE